MALEQEPDPLRRMPTKHTADMKAEIGAVLRAARLKRGQSLEAVAQQTRISKRHLEALEDDRFEQFPAVVYLRGFLKGYCEHLEVDFDALWSKFEASQAAAAPAPAAPEAAKDAPHAFTAAGRASLHSHPTPPPAAHAPAPAPRAAHAPAPHPAPAGEDHHAAASGAMPAIALAAALAIALGVWLFNDRQKAPSGPATTAPVALQPLPRAVEPKLVIRVKDDAWLRVAVDGQVAFEGRVPRGAVQEWKPVKSVGLRTTEPAALELELNGAATPLGAPGPDGEYRVEIP